MIQGRVATNGHLEGIGLTTPPPYVLRDYGLIHDFELRWFTESSETRWLEDGLSVEFTPVDVPTGMSVDHLGVLTWIPVQDVPDQVLAVYDVALYDGGEMLGTKRLQLEFTMTDVLPELEVSGYANFGWLSQASASTNVGLTEASRYVWSKDHLQFSFIDARPGVRLGPFAIRSFGAELVAWPLSGLCSGIISFPMGVRIEYPTPKGVLADEVWFIQTLLPPAGSISAVEDGTIASAHLGHSVSASNGYFVVGGSEDGATTAAQIRVGSYDLETGEIVLDAEVIESPAGMAGDFFGSATDLWTEGTGGLNVLVAGAPFADSDAEPSVSAAGRVDVFEMDGNGDWNVAAQLRPAVSEETGFFGGWVSVNGSTLVVGAEGSDQAASDAGSVEVFARAPGSGEWSRSQTLLAPDAASGDRFGWPCEINGEWIAVGARGEDEAADNGGAVYLFRLSEGQYSFAQKLLSPAPVDEAAFGGSVALVGEWLFVGAPGRDANTGAVFVFRWTGDEWAFQHQLDAPFAEPGSRFGYRISGDENVVTVSACGTASVPEPWRGVTRYALEGDYWHWQHHLPARSTQPSAVGFGIAQVGPYHTLAGLPLKSPTAETQGAGAVAMIEWPSCSNLDAFNEKLAMMDPVAEAMGDADGNGVPNLVQWAMGMSMTDASSWINPVVTTEFPPVTLTQDGDYRLHTFALIRGVYLERRVLSSVDLQTWMPVSDALSSAPEVFTTLQSDPPIMIKDGPQHQFITIKRNPSEPQRFFRIEVTIPPELQE